MRKRRGLPPRRLIRHLIAKPRRDGSHAYYWQPPTKLRHLPTRPAWLKNTPLRDAQERPLDLESAMKAAEALNARLDAWRAGRPGSRGGEMAALFTEWETSPAWAAMAAKTRAEYAKHLRALRDDIGEFAPAHVTQPAVIRYLDKMAAKHGVGARIITYRAAVLRQFWNWAKRRGLLAGDNPASQLDLKRKEPVRGIWTVEQLRAACRLPHPIPLAVRLALYTLQRQGDLLRMDRPENGVLELRQGKTSKDLALPICRRLRAALKLAPKRGDTIIATRAGKAYTEDGFRSIWQRHADESWPTFHSIRRTASTWLQRDGLSDEQVMLWTGHARQGDRAMVDVYVVRLAEMARTALPIMQRWRV